VNRELFIADYLDHFVSAAKWNQLSEHLLLAGRAIESLKERGGKLLFAGNGASASIASHYSLDFTKQAGVRSLAFNDAAFITAYGNDYGYERWVAEAIRHHGARGDIAILVSSSGRSPNILAAASVCRDLEISIITFTGFDGANPLRSLGEINFWAESRSYNVVESVHTMWLGALCDLLIGKREYAVTG
jgi:D-sedoheptulose 7-phosphate isomerase